MSVPANLNNNQHTSPGPRPVIVTGPTGVGKSAFALALAERIGGEIVGADAFQIYAGLPILTAQPHRVDLARKPHHLIGLLDPSESCDAARYLALLEPILTDITSRGRVPILCGGTGLYIKAFTHGLADIPRVDPALREQIRCMELPEALARLREADVDAPDSLDEKNPSRVKRALEIVLSTGRPLAESRATWKAPKRDVFGMTLTRERHDLRHRIACHVDAMFDEGVIEEVRSSGEVGPGLARAIGRKEILELIEGKLTAHQCREAIITATRQYAKRQNTWCRNQFNFQVIPLTPGQKPEAAVDAVIEAVRAHPTTP